MMIKRLRIILRVVFVLLHIVAWCYTDAYFDSASSGGSPESKALGLLNIFIAIPLFLCWVLTIWALYFMYCYFFKNPKRNLKVTSWIFLLITGLALFLLREELLGEDGIMPLFVFYGLTCIVSFLPAQLHKFLIPESTTHYK